MTNQLLKLLTQESVHASTKFWLVLILWPTVNLGIGVFNTSASTGLQLTEAMQSIMSSGMLQNTVWISMLRRSSRSALKSVEQSSWSAISSVSVKAVLTVLASP